MAARMSVRLRAKSVLTFAAAALSLAILPAAHAEMSEIHGGR